MAAIGAAAQECVAEPNRNISILITNAVKNGVDASTQAVSLSARLFTPLRSDPDLSTSNATPTEMKTAVPMKCAHSDFVGMAATRTCFAAKVTAVRIGRILIAHGTRHYIGVRYSEKARPVHCEYCESPVKYGDEQRSFAI